MTELFDNTCVISLNTITEMNTNDFVILNNRPYHRESLSDYVKTRLRGGLPINDLYTQKPLPSPPPIPKRPIEYIFPSHSILDRKTRLQAFTCIGCLSSMLGRALSLKYIKNDISEEAYEQYTNLKTAIVILATLLLIRDCLSPHCYRTESRNIKFKKQAEAWVNENTERYNPKIHQIPQKMKTCSLRQS